MDWPQEPGGEKDGWVVLSGVQEQGTNKKLQFDDFHTAPNQKTDLNAPSSKKIWRSLGNPLSSRPVSLNSTEGPMRIVKRNFL